MATREQIHQLVDELPESLLDEVARFLENRNPANAVAHALANAPLDDELESPEESEAIIKAYADVSEGRLVSHEEVLRRLSVSI